MSASPTLHEVLARHLGRPAELDHSLPPESVESRILLALGLSARLDADEARAALDAARAAMQAGVDDDTVFSVVQAYGRAIAPIADAEAQLVHAIVAGTSAAEQPALLDEFLTRTLPLTAKLFQTAHRARLRASLADALLPAPRDEPRVPVRAIAVIDIVSSTTLIQRGDIAATEDLVDALLEASQTVAASHAVTVVKYVGDGVILCGRDAVAACLAALAARELLASHAPGIDAHCGLASGPVVRRAGDYFGFAVNLAHRLAEVAGAGELLVPTGLVGELPGELERLPVDAELRGLGSVACERIRRAARCERF